MTDAREGLRPALLLLSRDVIRLVSSLREIELTSNSVTLVAWHELQRKVVILARISIESSQRGQRVWASVSTEPLIAPEGHGEISWAVGPSGLRAMLAAPFGGPFELAGDDGLARAQPQIVKAMARRVGRVIDEYGDLAKFAAQCEPQLYDDPLWITDAETQAYCLFASGRKTEASETLSRVVSAIPWDKMEPEDRDDWDVAQARAARSLAEMTTPGPLERRLDGWAQERLRSLGIDPKNPALSVLWAGEPTR